MEQFGLKLTVAVVVAALVACGDTRPARPDAPIEPPIDAAVEIDAPEEIPVFRNPVDMTDLELARAAATRLGIGSGKACDQCHALTRPTLLRWLEETRAADTCFTTFPTSQTEARTVLDCFRGKPTEPYDPKKLGIYTTGAGLKWFEAVTRVGYGAGSLEWYEWIGRVAMPRGLAPLTQPEFDIVAEWFARGLPRIEAVINDNPPIAGCTESITPAVTTHVAAMQTAGWRAINQAANLNMFGCGAATNPLDCLTSYPLSTANTWSAKWGDVDPMTKIRILYQYNYNSSFWTRSSADGRFVAHGGGNVGNSTIIDLQTPREIGAAAFYDPGFFPDNSGFVIQGGGWCRQSLLTSNPTQVTFNEPGCTDLNVVGLYQHLGAVQGGDYWAVAGQFVSDDANGEPSANFGASGHAELTPMLWTGSNYMARPETTIATPYEGDSTISLSAKLLVSRTSFMNNQSGFTLRKLDATFNGTSYDVTAPVIGRYCVSGGKPGFSFDDRWMVYHHWVQPGDWASLGYASATDPQFVSRLQAGTANIFLLELATGATYRVTQMDPGQKALFPHFRSDGWIYFIVKDITGSSNAEVVVASDAAIRYE